MDIITALFLVMISLTLGDLVSAKTKAFIPSVFVSAIIFIIGFWTLFPGDMVDLSGIGNPLSSLSMILLVTHMGTLMSLRELGAQWKTMVIGLAGTAGICIGAIAIGNMVFGWDTVVVATPPLTGGLVASIMMSDAASAKGLTDLAVLAVLMYVVQGFAGYPITALLLKKEGKKLLYQFRNGEVKVSQKSEVKEEKSKLKILPDIPVKYDGTYMTLLRTVLVAWLGCQFALFVNKLCGGEVLSKYIACLIFGAIAAEVGIVDRKPLIKAGAFGLLMTSLMAFIFAGLAKATPQMLAEMAIPLVGMIIFGVVGMGIFSIIAGKVLGVSKEMSFAIALTSLYGFPPNYILTEEAVKALAETEEENEYLMGEMLPQMIVGGFTTVTVASIVVAGIFVNLL